MFDTYAGGQGAVRLHLRHRRAGLPGDVRPAQHDERQPRDAEPDRQYSRLLPPAHGHSVVRRHHAVAAVSMR